MGEKQGHLILEDARPAPADQLYHGVVGRQRKQRRLACNNHRACQRIQRRVTEIMPGKNALDLDRESGRECKVGCFLQILSPFWSRML